MSDTPRYDALLAKLNAAKIAPVGYARAQDILLYREVFAGYIHKPADENGHPPVALYTQDQVDEIVKRELSEARAEVANGWMDAALKAEAECERLREDAERISQLQRLAAMSNSDNPDEVSEADCIAIALREEFLKNGLDLRAAIDAARKP